MFDLSFSELIIIAIVALLVIGPERLPQLARKVGAFVGRLQGYVTKVKDEINRESRFEELKALQKEIAEGSQLAKSSVDEVESIIASAHTNKPSKQVKSKKKSQKTITKKAASKKKVKNPSSKSRLKI